LQTRSFAPALGWELRPWTSLSSLDEMPARELVERLNLRSDWETCQVTSLSEEEYERLAAALARRGNSHLAFPFPTRVIAGQTYESYLTTRTTDMNKNMRRYKRRAEEAGLEFRDELSWKGIEAILDGRARAFPNGADYTQMPRFRAFFVQLRDELRRQGRWMEMGLYDGDRLVAYDAGFWNGRVFHDYQTGFDPAYSKLSPGMLAMDRIVHRALEAGAELVDFMGEQHYLKHFTRVTLPLRRVLFFSNGWKGRVLGAGFRLKKLLRPA
jgi:CelD/BcsL family acetyltransferase involved in cellulose biosynthesis